jgi:large subunit ribosomal protein L5
MSLRETYNAAVPELQSALSLTHTLAVPRLLKVTVSVGVGKNMRDEKEIALVENTILRITGQKPVRTKARKSIAGFKLREGQIVGVMVTLRGKRMEDFVEKLVHVTFPRVRDFRGLDTKNVDRNGNATIGFREHIAFPEVSPDEVDRLHGLAVTVTTTATTKEAGLALLRALGFPFKKD